MPKASSEANQLWPHLIKKVERVVRGTQGSTSGTPGAGGAPSPHALSSSHHTGALADSQAPQFLLVDGSRALTGNLAVDPGLTIDGVDLSAHVADPDAHHVRATAGDGIDITGQLIAVDVTDFIGTMYGLEESANDIRIKRSSDSGLAFGLAGGLELGTPGTISPTSANQVSGVTHYHDADSASDVSAGLTKLLHSASGGIILATLVVKGNVDITDGGDLTVGSNVLFVDVSQSSVGIMRAPDPQFALDVNGPIRGTELVGQHAIQLDDLAILLHYDGGFPYETNYTGEPNAVPMGQVPLINTNVHYRPGKFYKAAVFGKTGTNLCTNPSFEVSTAGWTVSNDGSGNLAISRASDDSWYGSWSGKLTWSLLNNSRAYIQGSATSTASGYTFSCWMRANAPVSVLMRIGRHDSPYTSYVDKYVDVTEEWQFFSATGVSAGGVPLRLSIFPTAGVATAVWVDGVQFENAGEPSWYMDGSLGNGHAWTGTEHLSTSTRANGYMTYALKDMVEHRWTLMGWFCYPNAAPLSNNGGLYMEMAGGDYVRITQSSTAGFSCGVQHSGGTATPVLKSGDLVPGQWYQVALAYSTGLLRGYIDGEEVLSAAYTIEGKPASLSVGAINGPQYGNVMLDDVVVSRQSLTANRIRAIYESDAPVFATSSVFSFRATPKGLVWADEEGLWMRDTDGDPVMGFYGGDAATKSWGGFTLAQGDIVFGQYGASDGGWFRFDRDGVSAKPYLSLGYSDKTVIAFDTAGASLDGVLDIGTSGGIYQGTGSFASPTTGLKVWNQSGVGRIGGYNGGVAQWYADSSGKLTAGAGNVVLDANGLLVISPTPSPPSSSNNKLTFATSGGVVVGEVYGYYASGLGEQHVYLETPDYHGSGLQGSVHLRGFDILGNDTELIINGPANTIDLNANVNMSADAQISGDLSLNGAMASELDMSGNRLVFNGGSAAKTQTFSAAAGQTVTIDFTNTSTRMPVAMLVNINVGTGASVNRYGLLTDVVHWKTDTLGAVATLYGSADLAVGPHNGSNITFSGPTAITNGVRYTVAVTSGSIEASYSNVSMLVFSGTDVTMSVSVS